MTEPDFSTNRSSEADGADKARLLVVSTVYPPSPPLEEQIDRFWDVGEAFDAIEVRIEPPEEPLALLEQLGTSPFERGEFPLIGFLATTYDKVSRYALERQ